MRSAPLVRIFDFGTVSFISNCFTICTYRYSRGFPTWLDVGSVSREAAKTSRVLHLLAQRCSFKYNCIFSDHGTCSHIILEVKWYFCWRCRSYFNQMHVVPNVGSASWPCWPIMQTSAANHIVSSEVLLFAMRENIQICRKVHLATICFLKLETSFTSFNSHFSPFPTSLQDELPLIRYYPGVVRR